jgi:hypothetical protein
MRLPLAGSALYASGSELLTVEALLFYEGAHTSMDGQKTVVSAERIDEIAAATQELLESGQRIKLFEDHRYTQRGTLGTIDNVEARDIESLPYPGMDYLLGLRGIFGRITLRGKEAIAAYTDGRLKELSAGIDFAGTVALKDAIFEASAVAKPALVGAALYGLTLEDTARANANGRDLWQEWELFSDTLRGIELASAEELGGRSPEFLKAQAVEDFATRLRLRFPMPTVVIPIQPLYGENMDLSSEQLVAGLKARIQALEQQLADQQLLQTTVSEYGVLREKGISLRDGGKLSPADFTELFPDQQTAIALFAANPAELVALRIKLETIEKYRKPVTFGSALGGQPLPEQAGGGDDAAIEAAVGEYFKKRGV